MSAIIRSAIFATLLLVAPSYAQAQSLPDSVRAAGITVEQWKSVQDSVKRSASARGTSERALAAIAQRVGVAFAQKGKIDIHEILSLIDRRAEELAELQSKLKALESADDPITAQLLTASRTAIDRGDLQTGDQLLRKASEHDITLISIADSETNKRRVRAAETLAERAKLASLGADDLAASKLYGQAAQVAPEDGAAARLEYTVLSANALARFGDAYNDTSKLHEAARRIELEALPLASKALNPETLAEMQNDLANIQWYLGKRGDDAALGRAVALYNEVLRVRTRETDPKGWATTQSNLGVALSTVGFRGNVSALNDAVRAQELALSILTPEEEKEKWVIAQSNLGVSLARLGEFGNSDALNKAIQIFIQILKVEDPATDPLGWAAVQINLGSAYSTLADQGDLTKIEPAILTYQNALSVLSRENNPSRWAMAELGLANAFGRKARLGEDAAFTLASKAYEAALTATSKEGDPVAWAMIHFNIALTKIAEGDWAAKKSLEFAPFYKDAISHLHSASEVFNQEAFPTQAQSVAGSLSAAHVRLAKAKNP